MTQAQLRQAMTQAQDADYTLQLRQLSSVVAELKAQMESIQSRIVAIGAILEAEKSEPGPGEARVRKP